MPGRGGTPGVTLRAKGELSVERNRSLLFH